MRSRDKTALQNQFYFEMSQLAHSWSLHACSTDDPSLNLKKILKYVSSDILSFHPFIVKFMYKISHALHLYSFL